MHVLLVLHTVFCISDFQGLNYIPPLPQFNGLYPSYLPDYVRVPGVKRSKTDKSSGGGDDTLCRDTNTADIKLNLITFAVSGQALSEIQMGNESDSQPSDEDEPAPVVAADSSITPLAVDRRTLSVQRIPNHDRTYMGMVVCG